MAQTITLPELGDCKIFTKNIEPSAMEQIKSLLSEDAFKGCKVRIIISKRKNKYETRRKKYRGSIPVQG